MTCWTRPGKKAVNEMQSSDFEYDLFFSYRHRPLDTQITQKLFNLVESYRLPQTLREAGCRQIRRAFRDTEELQVSRELTETIDQALHSADCLVVVCSTDTPSSAWVDREVAVFIERGRASHIYPLLINGDPASSFPPSLKMVPDIEERIMDIRCEDGASGGPGPVSQAYNGALIRRMMNKARTEILRVIADVAGCEEAVLVREHEFRRSRLRTRATAAALTVLALITGISFGLLQLARRYRDSAALHAEASLRILRELTYDLPDHLTNVPGAYSRIADLLEQNTEDLNAILKLSPDRTAAEYETAVNYEKLANARSVLGMYEEALLSEDAALEIFRRLAESGGTEGLLSCASACNNRGSILHRAGRYEEADGAYREAIGLLEPLTEAAGQAAAVAPGTAGEDPVSLLSRIWCNTGANAVDAGDTAAAEQAFSACLSLPGSRDSTDVADRETSALASLDYGILLYRSGRYGQAQTLLEDAFRLYGLLLEDTDSLQNRGAYLNAASVLAACLTDQGLPEEADTYYAQAIVYARRLAADGENLAYQRILADLCNNRGLCFNIRGLYDEAAPLYEEASDHYSAIYERTGAPSDAAVCAVSLLNTGENAFKAGDLERSGELFARGLALYEKIYAQLSDYDRSQYHAWRSYAALIHDRDADAAYDEAVTACSLQPDNVLANLNLAYACLYSGRYEECDRLFRLLASLGDGQKETIRLDLRAQQDAGLRDPHIEEVLRILEE